MSVFDLVCISSEGRLKPLTTHSVPTNRHPVLKVSISLSWKAPEDRQLLNVDGTERVTFKFHDLTTRAPWGFAAVWCNWRVEARCSRLLTLSMLTREDLRIYCVNCVCVWQVCLIRVSMSWLWNISSPCRCCTTTSAWYAHTHVDSCNHKGLRGGDWGIRWVRCWKPGRKLEDCSKRMVKKGIRERWSDHGRMKGNWQGGLKCSVFSNSYSAPCWPC